MNCLHLHTAARVKLANVTVSIGNRYSKGMYTVLSHLCKVQNQEELNNLWLRNTHIGGKHNKEK